MQVSEMTTEELCADYIILREMRDEQNTLAVKEHIEAIRQCIKYEIVKRLAEKYKLTVDPA